MYHKGTSNQFFVLSDLSEGDDDIDVDCSDADCHQTLPICFGDYIANAVVKRGVNDKRSSRGKRGSVDKKCRGSVVGRETSFNVSEYRSTTSLQHDSVTHVDDTLPDNLDPGWFKKNRGKVVRQKLNPFIEAKKALGMEEPTYVLSRPPAGDSVAKACKRAWKPATVSSVEGWSG
jgi:hypothetical protein